MCLWRFWLFANPFLQPGHWFSILSCFFSCIPLLCLLRLSLLLQSWWQTSHSYFFKLWLSLFLFCMHVHLVPSQVVASLAIFATNITYKVLYEKACVVFSSFIFPLFSVFLWVPPFFVGANFILNAITEACIFYTTSTLVFLWIFCMCLLKQNFRCDTKSHWSHEKFW